MIKFFRKLWQDRRGNALVIAGACLPMIVGAAGLASDTIQWTLWKRQLQRAADSAAIAGVYERQAASGATTTVGSVVSHDLTLNNHTWMSLVTGYPQVTYPADTSTMTNQVHVTLAIQQRLPFSSMFMTAAPTIIANATAASVPAGGDACIDARETSPSKTGVNITGNAGIYMPDCVIYSNSPATNSAAAGGSSNVVADSVATVGGVQSSNNWHVNAYRPYSPPIPDPFADVTPVPSDMNCATKTVVQGGKNVTTSIGLDENTDLSSLPSGTNCFTSLSVGSNKSLTLPPGTYYINGGDAFIQGDLTCNGCTIVLTNKDASSPIGQFKVNASSKINLTAPTDTTNPFRGIAIYQDRRATDSSPGNKINGNSASQIIGALYFPSQELEYNGTGNTDAVCTMFVARRINFSGNSATTNKFKKLADCGDVGLPSGGAIRMVRLVA
ncbi:MAG: pilus assembly protein TadG-related protein [Sphingomicrobium sp.]